MEIARVIIPQYIRRVETSKKQREIYFEWDGVTIKSQRRSIKIPKSYLIDKTASWNLGIENFRSEFSIAQIPKPKGRFKKQSIIYHRDNTTIPKVLIREKDHTIVTRDESGIPITLLEYYNQFKWILYRETLLGKEPVIANHTRAGKPGFYIINGQDIYNGVLASHLRGKVMDAIKDCFRPYIVNLPVISSYPIDIKCNIYDTIKLAHSKYNDELGVPWDVDNYAFPYLKAFPDLLKAEGKIIDDNRLYIPSTIHAEFHPIDDHENRKLEFIISKTKRPEIINNRIYDEFHNPKPKIDTGVLKLKL